LALTLKQIAELTGGEVVGDPAVVVSRVAPIRDAQPGDITFIHNEKYAPFAKETKASAIIVSPELRSVGGSLIVARNPYLAYAKTVAALMEEPLRHWRGVHPTAVVAESARLGRDVSLGPHVVVEADAVIGDRVAILASAYIGHGARVGDDTVIHPNASIYSDAIVGKRCTIHANVSIGSSGFGWAPDGDRYERIPQVGKAVIGDDVSIGAGSVVNRGALGDTIIGNGTKIDSLVIVSHNVEVGENCLFVSHVGVSGSVKIGNHVTLGGQVGVAGHLEIGDNAQVAAQSGVSHSLAPDRVYFGSPARPIGHAKRTIAAIQKLPELRNEIKHVQKRVLEIAALLDKDVGEMSAASLGDEKPS